MRKFTVIKGDKPERKPSGLGPRPDYLKKPRTYEDARRHEKIWKAVMIPASDLAQYAWFDRPPVDRTP